MDENFDKIDANIMKANREFRAGKESIKEKLKIPIRENSLVRFFVAVTIIVISFFVLWGFFIWRKIPINFYTILLISFASPAAIYYGMLVCDKLFSGVKK